MDGPRARFIGHPQQGAETAAEIMERLRFSAREIKQVATMVQHHLRPLQMSREEMPTHRALYRYFRDTGDAGIDILYLCLADHLATRAGGLDMAQWRYHTAMTQYVLEKQREEESLSRPAKLVDGHDIMEIFGLEPGPVVGELLETLRETQAAGEVSTREEALDYIKILLATRAEAPRNEANREEK
jgi:poly(A) polymerase